MSDRLCGLALFYTVCCLLLLQASHLEWYSAMQAAKNATNVAGKFYDACRIVADRAKKNTCQKGNAKCLNEQLSTDLNLFLNFRRGCLWCCSSISHLTVAFSSDLVCSSFSRTLLCLMVDYLLLEKIP